MAILPIFQANRIGAKMTSNQLNLGYFPSLIFKQRFRFQVIYQKFWIKKCKSMTNASQRWGWSEWQVLGNGGRPENFTTNFTRVESRQLNRIQTVAASHWSNLIDTRF